MPILKQIPNGGGTRVHFLAHDPKGKIQTRGRHIGKFLAPGHTFTLACDPECDTIGNGVHVTNEPRAVRCPECLATDLFKTRHEAVMAVADED